MRAANSVGPKPFDTRAEVILPPSVVSIVSFISILNVSCLRDFSDRFLKMPDQKNRPRVTGVNGESSGDGWTVRTRKNR